MLKAYKHHLSIRITQRNANFQLHKHKIYTATWDTSTDVSWQ
jgi:hypothetical protein